jgi:membrane dipeptidase
VKSTALSFAAFVFGALGAMTPPARGATSEPIPRVVDLHVDLPWQVHFRGRGLDLSTWQASVRALVAGHVGGLVLPIYLPDDLRPGGPTIDDAEAVLASARAIADAHAELVAPDAHADDASRIRTWLSIEGAGAFAADPAAIDRFIFRGVRLVGLAHAHSNALASAATDPAHGAYGLSDVGRVLARRIYDEGALVDVSHLSDRAFSDVAAIARELGKPIVATHSDARALAPHPRNLTDEQLRAIAASGGVVGLNLHARFLTDRAEATMADAVKQTLHLVHVAGIDHVAIGSDFEGGIHAPRDMADASVWPAFYRALRAAGLSHGDVEKIFHDNAVRILDG